MAAYAFWLRSHGKRHVPGASSAPIRRPGRALWRCSCSSASLSKAAASTSRLSTGSRCPSSWPLFLVPVFGGTQNYAAGFCMAAAYTAQSILIMLIWRQYLLPLWGLRYLAVRHRTGGVRQIFHVARPRDRGGVGASSRSESAARWRFLRWR